MYDFGFCWKLPKMINDNLVFLNRNIMDINISQYTKTIDKKHIENLAEWRRMLQKIEHLKILFMKKLKN